MDETASALGRLIAQLEHPMLIVTATAAGRREGCLVAFATQTSIEPVRFAVCVARVNRTHAVAKRAPALAVHVVPAAARELAELFGARTGDEVDKFARCRWREGPAGAAILEDCPAWFVGRPIARWQAGDHDAFVLEPIAAAAGERTGVFTTAAARAIEPGHPL